MFTSLDHHAYVLVGSRDDILPRLWNSIERSGTTVRGNPDVRLEIHERMGISEAQALKESAERTAVTGGKKIFVVAIGSITVEAQNALLKIVEEPPHDTHFFFVLPTTEILLPTLRSRVHEVSNFAEHTISTEASLPAETFLKSSLPARLRIVAKLLKTAEEEEKRGKIFEFLDHLEHVLADDTKTRERALSELLIVKKYSRDRAPSFKLLLEHLALVLPRR